VLLILPYNPERDGTKMVQRSPSGSITSFLQLAELFSTRFVAGNRDKKTSIHIVKIRQAKGEDLKEYVMRFNREAILISDLQDGVAYAAFLNGLLPGRFKFFLVENKVTTLADALRRAQDFIQASKYALEMICLARCFEKSARR